MTISTELLPRTLTTHSANMNFSLILAKNYRIQKNVPGMHVEKPLGESVQWDKYAHSNAEVDFTSESCKQSRSVNIYDYVYILNLYLPYQISFK